MGSHQISTYLLENSSFKENVFSFWIKLEYGIGRHFIFSPIRQPLFADDNSPKHRFGWTDKVSHSEKLATIFNSSVDSRHKTMWYILYDTSQGRRGFDWRCICQKYKPSFKCNVFSCYIPNAICKTMSYIRALDEQHIGTADVYLLFVIWENNCGELSNEHYNDFIMSTMASQISSVSIFYSSICSGVDQRKHQSSASRGPVNFPHKGPITR